MRAMSYLMLGIVGTIAYQRMSENSTMLSKEMRRMMKNNNRTMKKIKEIF